MQAQSYIIFHLNIAFSSIAEEARPALISRCYWPLLRLIRSTGIPVGIELTGWTLERIRELDAAWVHEFKLLLHEQRCELIGSGYTQMIGPIVPHEVNQWNQRLGLEVYASELDLRPQLVLVNEMAFSGSMVNLYHGAGYRGFIMDRDNIRLALEIEGQPMSAVPTHACGMDGITLPVLWSDSILFQKLQQFTHGDIGQADYLGYLQKRIGQGESLLPVYCNDAEVFDFRPGRFSAESHLHPEGEWVRLERLFRLLPEQLGVIWRSPSDILQLIDDQATQRCASLVSAAHPIPTKKQAKYNIARWAATGRNDTWINTLCHRIYQRMAGIPVANQDHADWRSLCELWASDLRTHITQPRWDQACNQLGTLCNKLSVPLTYGATAAEKPGAAVLLPDAQVKGFDITRHAENILLTIETPELKLVLNLRRGLAIHSLALRSHEFIPTLGTLPHGYFSSIAMGADYYSGGLIIEQPGSYSRLTDLERVEPLIFRNGDALCLRACITTTLGVIEKTITVYPDRETLTLEYAFPGWARNRGVIRAGIMTLLPKAFDGPLALECANGGPLPERFILDRPCDHIAPSSTLVSSTNGLGATTGHIVLGNDARALAIDWNPAECAVLPLLQHKPGQQRSRSLTRLFFSLQELDDTARPEGRLGTFKVHIGPGTFSHKAT